MRAGGQEGRISDFLPVAGAALLLCSSNAHANGRYPEATQLVVDPGAPSHVVVRATYGILTTRSAGAKWDWICEGAVGFNGPEDPAISITPAGTVLAGLIEGLSVARGDTCTWAPASPSLWSLPVIDVSARKTGAKSAFAIAWRNEDGATLSELWRSDDDAATWIHAGSDPPADFGAVTVDVAPSDDQRIYMSGGFAPPAPGAGIERSDDGGATWARFDIPGTSALLMPYLGAIDPKNPDILYARVNGDDFDWLVSSSDGGAHWSTIFKAKGELLGFALSPDGSKIAVGGPSDGVLIASSSSPVFNPASPLGATCLAWTDAGLYACADEPKAGFTIGLSSDNGHTFSPLLHRAAITGPLTCSATTSVGATCAAAWPATQCLLDSTCPMDPGSDHAITPLPAAEPVTNSCACRATPSGGSSASSLIWLAPLAWISRSRRRARRTIAQ